MTGPRVLVVDDEVRFREALVRSLKGHDYDVRESATGGAAIKDVRVFNPDVVLLDLMLPDSDGISVCRELRKDFEAAIIVLSVRRDEQTKVEALDGGADDYLTKPFVLSELLARIRAVLRRAVAVSPDEDALDLGALRLDVLNRLVYLDGDEIHLTPIEFTLLRYFVTNAGKVLRHKAILRAVWGEEYVDDIQILRTYINQLRTKLRDSTANPRFIYTDPGIGYRFVSPPAKTQA